jgi:RimJ/RimL family protein N-acetyltransferase
VTQPGFRTARLTLRPRGLEDTPSCLAMDREPGVTAHVDGPWDDPVAHRRLIERRTLGPWPSGMGYWTVERGGAFCGWVCLVPVGESEVEVGWRLRPALWGRGYATEAARPLLAHGFGMLALPALVVRIAPENLASLRVAAKLGFPAPVPHPDGFLLGRLERAAWPEAKPEARPEAGP